MKPELLMLFIPTIAAVSLTPGMCMMLAFSLGISEGYRRTLWMMLGELFGVAVVVSATVWLLQNMMRLDPMWFRGLMVVGALYLLWVARALWLSEPATSEGAVEGNLSGPTLVILGCTTAVMNPKGWAFMLALLPGFMLPGEAILGQLSGFLSVIMVTEFLSMSLYAISGQWLRGRVGAGSQLRWLNKLAAMLMVIVSTLVIF
jgi:threonine/homoserine/homoserine lactone efflux protein